MGEQFHRMPLVGERGWEDFVIKSLNGVEVLNKTDILVLNKFASHDCNYSPVC